MTLLLIAAVSGSVCVLTAMKKSGHFLKSVCLSAVQGTAALLAVNAAGVFTGVTLHVNALSLALSVLFGTPGVLLQLAARVILR